MKQNKSITQTKAYGRQYVDQSDIDAVVRVLKSDWLTTGPVVEEFEEKLSKDLFSAEYCVSCNSGTAGLHLALLALGIGPGDYVIVPAITFVATANVVRLVGADVVFADINPLTGLMDIESLTNLVSEYKDKQLKAVINVHFAGQVSSQKEIYDIARKHDMKIIDDACHAPGTTYYYEGKWRDLGDCCLCDVSVFSFHPVKNITTGEGGAVTTNDADVFKKISLYRNHGIERDSANFEDITNSHDPDGQAKAWYYEMQYLGLNYRLSAINCALGLSQLDKIHDFKMKRELLVDKYRELISDNNVAVQTLVHVDSCRPAWHIYPILIDFNAIGITRSALMKNLSEKNIGTQVHYIPVYHQPYYKTRVGDFNLKGTEEYYSKTLTLPLHYQMGLGDVEVVVKTLFECIDN